MGNVKRSDAPGQAPPLTPPLKGRGLLIITLTLALAACATAPKSSPAPPADAPPSGMQYLYGSAEAAAASIQAYHAFADHVLVRAGERSGESVVLAQGATLGAPRFVPCGAKPVAVILDIDETALLNLGYEYDEAKRGGVFDEARWKAWEDGGAAKVSAVPGAVEALALLRKNDIAVIFNSNRDAQFARQTSAALAGAGLGVAVHQQSLFLKGDDKTGSLKDGRRAAIAARYCIVAMAGDQLGDFSDMFNLYPAPAERRAAAAAQPIADLWGNGWFVLPNPVYGSALKGGYDDVFPADKRWPR